MDETTILDEERLVRDGKSALWITSRDIGHGEAVLPSIQFNFSHVLGNKIYIAKQQNCLTAGAGLAKWEPCWVSSTGIGTYPPKPPPLVELQRNPQGLRFFLPENMLQGSIVAIDLPDCQFFNQSKPDGLQQGRHGPGGRGTSVSSLSAVAKGRKSRLLYSDEAHRGLKIFVFVEFGRARLPAGLRSPAPGTACCTSMPESPFTQ